MKICENIFSSLYTCILKIYQKLIEFNKTFLYFSLILFNNMNFVNIDLIFIDEWITFCKWVSGLRLSYGHC